MLQKPLAKCITNSSKAVRKLLLKRFEKDEFQTFKDSKRSAAHWFCDHEYFDEALELSYDLEDWTWAIHIIEKGGSLMKSNGERQRVYRWFDHLPMSLLKFT